jgi:hypothetical protein
MEYLTNRKFREASLAVAAWEKDQVFPLELTTGIASEKQNSNRDIEASQNRIKMLNTIFESKPENYYSDRRRKTRSFADSCGYDGIVGRE